MTKFVATKEEIIVIGKIAKRAGRLFENHLNCYKRMDIMMDIEAVHCNGTPLRLEALLKAKAIDFVHDISGIREHIDRENGTLKNCFFPRCAR